MLAPNGISASFAILKHCNPNGIPTMVMQKTQPITAAAAANSIPETRSQMIFSNNEPAPPPYSISLPNGKNARLANLNHCIPIGIPTIVMHHKMPAISHPIPNKNPPKTNQSKLPKHPKAIPPFYATNQSQIYLSIGKTIRLWFDTFLIIAYVIRIRRLGCD